MSRFKKGSTQLAATKEEIDSGSHKLAALKEWLVNIVGNRTFGRRVKRNEVRAVIGMGWRCTWKETDNGGRKPKARFFAKGFLDGRLVNTYIGTPSVVGINTIYLFIVFTGMEMGAADVTAAFLTSKDHNAERVGATLPSVLPRIPEENPFKDIPDDKYEELKMAAEYEPGGMYLVEMGLYGLPCVAQLFDHKLEGVCKELGFKRVDMAIAGKAPPEGGRAQAIVMNWIDDLLTGAPPKEHKVLQETLNKRLGFGILHSIELQGDLWSLLENWIAWATKRAGQKVGSSTAGEVLAFKFLFKKLFGIVALVKAMWGLKKVRVIVYTDSGPLHDQFQSGKAQTDTTMQGILEWCIQEMCVLGADLQWIARARNMANMMTKCALPGGEMA
uniref:Reverse transcriptase Ty1/copia-type domain-containing protein n=1 Tax=Chromera velia CCMP2878 TaxID=1169474 RepID=A0A0G4IA37_9ALVE|eukprot:Cvel_12417.t1-p1 / transcript=Cvel_12417.t1 / gene=Cvel_12417 / organism=Chromera_velia_CCMP2878 / gene_product=hypothetical protein / transcript_product=hypothetical protein / location=Cvel_scaffold812:43859-45521(-) / protein_length=386 / sequence_SO=supercontig / SO=protein_coding / is_pseudo=false